MVLAFAIFSDINFLEKSLNTGIFLIRSLIRLSNLEQLRKFVLIP